MFRLRWIAVGALFGLALGSASSCLWIPGDPPRCTPATCLGCCTPAGDCLAGNETAACGTSGAACTDCTHIGGQCVGGGCGAVDHFPPDTGPDLPTCGPETCPNGCCAANGTLCLKGRSFTNCGSGGAACVTCGTDESCMSVVGGGQCQTYGDPVPAYGSACLTDSDCEARLPGTTCRKTTAIYDASYPSGYCTSPCGDGGTCASGGACTHLSSYGEDALCLAACSPTNPCRTPGYKCYATAAGGVGICWLDPIPSPPEEPPPPTNLGAACESAADCGDAGDELCLESISAADGGATGWTDGYCSKDCSLSAFVCGQSALCGTAEAAPGAEPRCLVRCNGAGTGQGDCRSGYVCAELSAPTTDDAGVQTLNAACIPSCSAAGASCPGGKSCDALGYCE